MNRGIGQVFSPKKRTLRTFGTLLLGEVVFKTLLFTKNFFMRIGMDVTEVTITISFFNPLMSNSETEAVDTAMREEILKNFPNLKTLVVGNLKLLEKFTFFPKSLEEIIVMEANLEHQHLRLPDVAHTYKEIKGVTRLKSFRVGKLEYACNCLKNKHTDYIQDVSDEVLQIVQEMSHLQNLEGISSGCNTMQCKTMDPICVSYVSIHNMHQFSYKSIAKLPNLAVLHISLTSLPNSHCFTDHEESRVIFKNIIELQITLDNNLNCDHCITGFLKSFPKLKVLFLHGNVTDDQARLIFTSMPELEDLKFISNFSSSLFDASEFQPNSIENLKKLTSLKIISSTPHPHHALNNESFLKFASLPNLQTLHLIDRSSVSFSVLLII